MHRLTRRLRDERGIALVIALGMLTVMAVSLTSVIYATGSNSRSATNSRAHQIAFGLAEAGINNAMAVLSLPTNNALKQEILPVCTGPQESWNANSYEGGAVQWCGTLILAESAWRLTSVGTATRPGASGATRRLSAYVPVQPTTTQPLNNPAWNYVFATNTGSVCDTTLNENIEMESAFFVQGNLCLDNGAKVRVGPLIVKGRLSLAQNAQVGASNARIEVQVGGQDTGSGLKYCKQGNGHWHPDASHASHAFCGDTDNVFSKLANGTAGVSATAANLTKPHSDFEGWYPNAMPGPTQDCTTKSGTTPVWDTDSVFTTPNGSVATPFNLTPATSYTCYVGPSTGPAGELSWNHSTRVLKITGTIFIDGSAHISNGLLNTYTGQGTLYLSGTFKLGNGSKMCGGVSGGNCAYSTWNPNTSLFVIAANGNGGQVAAGNSIVLENNSQWQGALYATNGLTLNQNVTTDGPLVAGTFVFSQNYTSDEFGTITTVPVGMPDNPQVYAQPNPPQNFTG